MADVMKLALGATEVTFSPLLGGYDQPDDDDITIFEASEGTRYYSSWGKKQKHDVMLKGISKADADQLNTWWQSGNILTFTPDVSGAPATTIHVLLLNDRQPFQMWFDTGWQNNYEGQLIIHEASSSSSSP